MIIQSILTLNVFFTSYSAFANEFDSDEDMYMFVSPDQHLRTPRLEDFFWTGSGDGPPPPDIAVPAPSPSTPIVRTTTVLATVYLDSYPPQAVTDKTTGDCILNCGEVSVPDSLEPEIPEDRRYWLLTVIQGSTPDSLQLRLARLYQKAFLRQQEKHLGIIKSLDAPTPRKKHDVHSFVVNKDNNFNISANSSESEKYLDIHSSLIDVNDFILSTITTLSKHTSNTLNTLNRQFQENLKAFNKSKIPAKVIKPTKLSDSELWVLVTPTVILKKREVPRAEIENVPDLIDIPLEEDTSNGTSLFKREILKPEQQPPVRVHIQNITESSETGSVQIVYVVLVGGRAVPAAVAARDMRLVRDAEVASELGAAVTTKAEPAYLKAAEGLEGAAEGVHGAELWALAVGASVAVLLLLVLLALLCFAHKRKSKKSAASFRAYRNELMREVERSQMKQVHEERDGKLISVVSPSRTRPSSTLLPVYRAGSASGSSTTSSGVSEVAAALRRRQKKPHALKMPHKKRVGTTDSLLVSAGVDSSDSAPSAPNTAPHTPTSYLSMPSIAAFPRRLGSIDKDPGVIGPLVWDLHCQRIKSASKSKSPVRQEGQGGASRMRQRYNELVDDAFTLFGSASSASRDTYTLDRDESREQTDKGVTQACNDNVRLAAGDTARGRSAGAGRGGVVHTGPGGGEAPRPRTSFTRVAEPRAPPARAWGHTPTQAAAEGRLPADDPALPLISAIKDEIKRVRDNTSNKT
ncbi:PREDICTED: uncharacterized protein LOC106105337 [Papilio polytes]|uniref:uncharacterized protein LOC106105337 n=1 Tax=Papilio polytes TaxID=76194 RepID=UPI000676A4AD|nr:PREDICTED: uncharacterized protein LOC106105337 [Papilio polytes]